MTTAITLMLLAITLGVGLGVIIGYNILLTLERCEKRLSEIVQHQLNPRTRISTIGVQSGPITDDQTAARVGRATSSRRVIVGGDPESELSQSLGRQFPQEDEDE